MRRGFRGSPPGTVSWVWGLVASVLLRPLLRLIARREWRGQEHVPRTGGVIIATNHLSWADPLYVALFIYNSRRWPVFLAKSTLFNAKVLGYLLRRLGQLPVYRHRTDVALVLKDAEQGVRDGACVIVYPEGTCTRDPDLWPMTAKTGVARLALATGAPVIPIAHWGAQELLPYGAKRPRLFPRKRIRVVAGPPVDLSRYRGQPINAATLRAATADVMRDITLLLAEIRGERPPEVPYDSQDAIRYTREKDKSGRAWQT